MKAWPFLFSRGYVLDNQIIVCPEIFESSERWGEFSRIVARRMAELTDDLKVEEIKNSVVGNITLVYSTSPAMLNGKSASDVAGRAVRMVRGFVVEGLSRSKISAGAADLMARVTPSLDAKFRAFWDQREEHGPRFSEGFEVYSKPHPPSPPPPSLRWRLPKVVAAVALVSIALLTGTFYKYHSHTSGRIKALEDRLDKHEKNVANLEKKVGELLDQKGKK